MPAKISILIVDDDEQALETLSDILQERGFYTETAKTGKEALAKAEERFFNVVLLDMKLPDITGIEVLQTLTGKQPSPIAIIMTAYATTQNAVDAMNLGANAYIIKPIDQETLFRTIKECLRKQERFILRNSRCPRKIPVSIALSNRIIQKIDLEASRQKRSRSEWVELHFETYFFKEFE